MSNQWLRLWHDMPNDPKWRVIAKASGQPVHLVMALYVTLLVDASKNTMSRGVTTCHDEDLSVTLDCDMSQIEQIKQAMQGRVLDGNRLKGWETRQPKREDLGNTETGAKSAAERQRERRERLKTESKSDGETQCHEASRNVTIDKDKDKDKDKNKTSLSSGDDLLGEEGDEKSSLPCPYEKLRDVYHKHFPAGAKVLVLNDQRKRAMKQRWLEASKLQIAPFGYASVADGLSAWAEFFDVCRQSDFLAGRSPPTDPNRKAFVADMDFFMKPSSFAKCLENKYH